MRRLLILAFLFTSILSVETLNAQFKYFDFRLKAGVSLPDFGGDFKKMDRRTSFVAGIGMDYYISTFMILGTGVEVVQKGAKYKYWDADTERNYNAKFSPIYLQVPLQVGYNITLNDFTVRASAGTYFAYGLSGKARVNVSDADGEWIENESRDEKFFQKNAFKRFDMGVGMLTTMEYKKVGINIGYDYGLLNIADFRLDDKKAKVRNRNGYISLSWKFWGN